ncbi:MAG TPA: UbiA family prenyltransferase [Gemmataceae bacterium]|nr:UbiA family prenyltransferase [Gemmataceae bacterium]
MSESQTDSPAVDTAAPPTAHPFTFLPYAQLLRLPNVFTAMADICLAALALGALPGQILPFLLLLLASSCLYCAGMVWNDYFDLEEDKRDRPFRPLPTGKVSLHAATTLGTALLAAGVALVALAGAVGDGYRVAPLVVALVLAVTILLYDAWLKRTVVGPVAMGACRFLNVMLGLTVMAGGLTGGGVFLAIVVGVYIVGVTWFARTEAKVSNQGQLIGAAAVMLTAFLFALAVPALLRPAPRGDGSLFAFVQVGLGQVLFLYLLVAFGFYLAAAILNAIADPVPGRVQAAVKRGILGLVWFDAILAAALAGTVGLALALLLIPATALGRRLYST